MLVGAIAERLICGSPTRARTWDLRINSPSILYVISLHHQLLTASAHLRYRSRMQCNAGVRKTALLRFCIQVTIDQRVRSVGLRKCVAIESEGFPFHTTIAPRRRSRVARLSRSRFAPNEPLVRRSDIALAEEGAMFGYPEVHHGITPYGAVPTMLNMMKSKGDASLLLTGRKISAAEALPRHSHPRRTRRSVTGELDVPALVHGVAGALPRPSRLDQMPSRVAAHPHLVRPDRLRLHLLAPFCENQQSGMHR